MVEVNINHAVTIGIESKLCFNPFRLDGRGSDIVGYAMRSLPLGVEDFQNLLQEIDDAGCVVVGVGV